MKKNLYIICSLVAFLALAIGCSPEEPGPIDAPESRVKQLSGTWQISEAIQVDENAKFKGFPDAVTYKEITHLMPEHPYTDFKITLKEDGAFTVDKGNALVDIPDTQGTWTLNRPEFATAIILKGANGKERQLDLIDVEGLRYTDAASRTFQLGLVRYLDNKPFVSYRYQMVYSNN